MRRAGRPRPARARPRWRCPCCCRRTGSTAVRTAAETGAADPWLTLPRPSSSGAGRQGRCRRPGRRPWARQASALPLSLRTAGYPFGCWTSTGGRSCTCCLVMFSRIPSPTPVTALIGIATSLRPHRCPSWSSTWVTRWLSGSMTSPWTFPMWPSVAWTCSPAAHLHLVQGDGVVGDGLRAVVPGHAPAHPHAHAVVGHPEHLVRVIARVPGGARQELRLLGGIEFLEVRQGAAEPDLTRRDVGQASGTSGPGPCQCPGSTTRWVTVRATGFTTTRVTLPQAPSLQLTPAPT